MVMDTGTGTATAMVMATVGTNLLSRSHKKASVPCTEAFFVGGGVLKS